MRIIAPFSFPVFLSIILLGANTEASAQTPQPVASSAPPRKDLYADPLPPGAVARFGSKRFRVPYEAVALAFAPDGKSVAVDSGSRLYLFDANTGKRKVNLGDYYSYHHREDRALLFSPDSKRFAARGYAEFKDGKSKARKSVIRVWDLGDTAKPRVYVVERVIRMAWSANGNPQAVCLEKGAVSVREVATGRSRRFECADLYPPHMNDYVKCGFSSAGRTLAFADKNGNIHVWETASGRKQHTIPPKKNNYLRGVTVARDGNRLATLYQESDAPYRNTIEIFEATTGRKTCSIVAQLGNLNTLTYSPDGKILAAAGWDGITCWDAATGREISRCEGPGANSVVVNISADGKTMATLERHSPAFHLWDVATGKRKPQPAGHTNRPDSTTFSPDGRRLASGGMAGSIHVWVPATGKSVLQFRRGGWLRDVAFSHDGRLVFSTSTDDELRISNATTGKTEGAIKLDDPKFPDTRQSAIAMHQSADGKTLVALSYYYGKKDGDPGRDGTLITGWDAATRKLLFRRQRLARLDIAVSADAGLLAASFPGTGNINPPQGLGPMRLEGLATGKRRLDFPAPEGQTWPREFSPDARLLASSQSVRSKTNFILWEVATASKVLTMPMAGQPRVAFSRDGRLMALPIPNSEILVWDLARGKEWRRFKGIEGWVSCIAFTPDGSRLVTGLSNSTLLLWDVESPPPRNGKLSGKDLNQAWTDLAGKDAPRAFRARGKMAMAPKSSLPFLRKRLKPARPADPQRLRKLIADLDSRKFKVRAAAQRELDELADLAAPALMQALQKKPTLEVALQIDGLLKKLLGPVTRPEQLRIIRAVAVLEDIANAEARALLHALAKGAAGARLTQEASAARRRLALRRSDDR